mgnify:CR=1 FL=1
MFLSINRKIIYSIFGLFLISSFLFISTFYIAYSSKIEQDQQASILRNQQYSDLLYRNINMIKEIKQLLNDHQEISLNAKNFYHLKMLTDDSTQSDFLIKEQKAMIERSQNFDEQYRTIDTGIKIIISSAIILALFIILLGWLISRWILKPINKISVISEQVGAGNLNLRIPLRKNIHYPDELDNLSQTFNMMLDNLQKTISEIKTQENFLQALIDSIPDGIRVIDENYSIVIANKSYYKQSGDKPRKNCKCYTSAFKNTSLCNLHHIQCPIHEILDKGRKNINTIQQFAHNPKKHLAVNAAPLIYDSKHKYIIESIRDLSEDIDFSHQQKLSSLGFLSSSIAHEIKNHLGALRIIMEHLIDKYYTKIPDSREDKKMINMIHSELVHTVEVPERLLKLTRGYGATETEIDCAACITDVLELLDFEAKSKGIEIIFHAPQKACFIKGNETDFKIAVINIILNAVKAMPDKGTLTIKITSSKATGIQISFADTGIGISKANLQNIFAPFFSEGHQNKNNKGSGLGLAITKSIIEKSGGTITVESTLGKGSCFTFCFPENKKLAKK